MSKIVLVGALDTKGVEFDFLRTSLNHQGLDVTIIDVGVLGEPAFAADVSSAEVAHAAGAALEDLRAARDRGTAVEAMMRGATAKVRELHMANAVAGILSIGGSAGTTIATAAMRALPVGVPKLMVSTLASGDVRPYVGTKDITMMYSVADFSGLNRLTRRILTNAANAIGGMIRGEQTEVDAASDRPLIGATMFGVTTPCVNRVGELLEREGYEALIFHATGSGGRSMEELIHDGFIKGVIDITTTELADELVGGVLSAGPNRMEIAGQKGLPQVISLGALDMVNFGPPDTIPEKFLGRKFYQHNPSVTLMRTTPDECSHLGSIIAEKANRAKGPVIIAIPLKGVSAIDAEGQVFHDPEADSALFDALRENVRANVELVEVDAHINDEAFAQELLRLFLSTVRSAR